MPHLYYIELSNNDYTKYFQNVDSEIRNEMEYLYDYIAENKNCSLDSFLDGALNVHLENMKILSKYDLHTDYLPNKKQSVDIFKKLKEIIQENDIISIFNYRGSGQYYVYNDDGELNVTLHTCEYGRQYPPQSARYFLDSKIYEHIINDSLQSIYTKYNVFHELHRTNLYDVNRLNIMNINVNYDVCGLGLCVNMDDYNITSYKGIPLSGFSYLVMDFCYENDNPDAEDIILIDKKYGTTYNLKCVYYESNELY